MSATIERAMDRNALKVVEIYFASAWIIAFLLGAQERKVDSLPRARIIERLMRFTIGTLSRIVFILMLLAPVLLILPSQSNASPTPCAGRPCNLQGYPSPTQPPPQPQPTIIPTTIETCDPTVYYIEQVYDEVKITGFMVDKATYRPGDSLRYSGDVQVGEVVQYANCYGQGYTGSQEVSPSQANVHVKLLGGSFALTPSSDGSFGGSYSIPFTEPSGGYTAYVTATFGTATDSASASFRVEAYQPVLSVTYASAASAAFPGENVILVGNGWIPNMEVHVYVDDNYTTTPDSTGHFELTIPIPETQPFQEGAHNITVTQVNLVMEQSFTVKYHELIVNLNSVEPIAQGDTFTVSGNVTATETGRGVVGANVTVIFMGKQFNATTDSTGSFKTDAIGTDVSIKPGSYNILANATRLGFRASKNTVEAVKLMPKLNVAAVTVAVASGAAVGAAISLKGKISKPSVTPGSEQVVAKVGPGRETSIGPGLSGGGQTGARQIQPGPLPGPSTSEFCIHCGSNIARGSKKCPDCGIRLR